MSKLELRRKQARDRAYQIILKEFPNLTKLESQAIIETVLEYARIYKQQKILMMVDLMTKTSNGEYQ